MNERIKELILEAGFPKFDEMYVVTDGKELEKFAELIVRECAGLCLTHEISDEPFGEKSYRKGWHFDAIIRQHFGVEG